MAYPKKTLITLLIFIGVAMCIDLGVGLWWKASGSIWLQNLVNKSLDSDVNFQNAKTNFLTKFYLEDISVSRPFHAHASSIAIQLHPWRFIFPFESSRNMFSLQIVDLNVEGAIPAKSGATKKFSFPTYIPAVLLSLQNASLRFITGNDIFVLEKISGTFFSDGNTVTLNLKSGDKKRGKIDFFLTSKLNTKLISIQGTLSNYEVAPLCNSFLKSYLPAGKWSGDVSADYETQIGFNQENPIFEQWNINFLTPGVQWLPSEAKNGFIFSATGNANSTGINFRSIKINKNILLEGRINSPYSNPSLMIKARVENTDMIYLLKPLFPSLDDVRVSAPLTLSGDIRGTLKAPIIHSAFYIQPSLGAFKLPVLKGQCSFENQKVLFQSAFADGSLNFNGIIQSRSLADLSFDMNGVSLSVIGKLNDWKNIHGLVYSKAKFSSKNNHPTLNGDFHLNNFSWGRLTSAAIIKGAVDATREHFIVTTFDQSLAIQCQINKSKINLSQFDLNLSGPSSISARGQLDLDKSQYHLQVEGKNIQPDLWPPLVAQFPDITGNLDFNGTVEKMTDVPSADGKLAFHETRFIPGGHEWEGKLNLKLDKEGFSFDDIHVERGFDGKVSRKINSSTKMWTADLTMSKGDPYLFSELLKSTMTCSGFLNGKLNGSWDGNYLVGTSSISWNQPKIQNWEFDRLDFSVSANGNVVTFDNLSLFDQEKALRASLRLEKQKEDWKYNLQTQSQQWGSDSFAVDGELDYSGVLSWNRKSIIGSVYSPSLTINEFPIENLTGKYEGHKNIWNCEVNSRNVRLKGMFNSIKNFVSVNVSGDGLSVRELFSKLLFPDHPDQAPLMPDGEGNFVATISGAPDRLYSTINLNVKNGLWRKEYFDAKSELTISASTISVVTSTIAFKNGGTVSASGRIIPEEEINFEGFGKTIPINTAFHLLNWPLNWHGTTDAQFKITGDAVMQKTVVNFDGVHKGFGPFSEPGIIQGQTIGENEEWDLSEIRVTFGNGFVQALPGSRVYMDKGDSGRIHITSDIRNLKSGVLTFFGQTELTGVWGKNNSFDSSHDHSVDFDVYARPLWVNQLLLNGNITHLAIKKSKLEFSPVLGSDQQITGTLNYENYPTMTVSELRYLEGGIEQFFLNGDIGVNHWDFDAHGHDMDASVVSGLLDIKFPIEGPMGFDVHGTGTPFKPGIEGHLTLRNAKVGPVPVDHVSSLLNLKNGIVELKDIKASRKNGFDISGFISFPTALADNPDQNPRFNLKLEKGDLRILKDVIPEVTSAKGSFKAEIISHTEKNQDLLTGSFHADGIQILTNSYFPSIKCTSLNVTFKQGTMHIEPANLKIGHGVAQVYGQIDYDGTQPYQYNVVLKSVTPEGISLRIPELTIQPGPFFGKFNILRNQLSGASRGDFVVDLSLTGPDSTPILAGNVLLENTVFTYPPLIQKQSIASNVFKDFFIHKVFWDVELKAGDRTRFENELVDAIITGNIHFYGPSSALVINGKILSDQGEIVYSGNEFKLTEAQLEIFTPFKAEQYLEPNQTLVYLRGKAEREVYYTDGLGNSNQDTITMELDRSLIGEIRPRFYSKNNPAISSEKALQLALGFNVQEVKNINPLQNTTPQTQAKSQEDVDKMLRAGVIQLVDSGFASPLARALARSTGLVDTIRVSYQPEDPLLGQVPEASATTNASQNQTLRYIKGTKVKFGRGVSNRLYADYSVKVDEFENQLDFRHEVELAYRLKRSLFIRAISELDSQRTLGRAPDRRAILENQWRFGLPLSKRKTPVDIKTEPKTAPLHKREIPLKEIPPTVSPEQKTEEIHGK